jgi:eukaryotic-like serine/threonine-protein kinase
MIGGMLGNFKVVEKIGEGGMGSVYRGFDVMLEREVAIKMLRPELASQPEVVERFRTEAITLAKLNHPNIATLYTFLRDGEDYFMVMEFVRGETLDDAIRRFGAMTPDRAIPLFCQALEGIDHAHRMGIVHRDLKPANVMLTESGSIKVMDFGIARVLGTARMTRQGNVVGTVEYMSPEQVRGLESDARSDVYSLGIVLYEMLTGRVPFNCDSEFELMKAQVEQAPTPPRTLSVNIPLAVEQAIMRSLAKKPIARYQTAGEFRSVLMGALGATTNLLDKMPIGYAAPVTRSMEKPPDDGTMVLAAQPEPVKQTKIAGSLESQTASVRQDNQTSPVAGRTGEAMKAETSIQTPPPQPPASSSTHRAVASPQKTPRGKLNWKHYSAATVALLVLIGTPLVLMATRTQPPAPVTEQAEPPPAETEQPPASVEPAEAQSAPPVTAENSNENSNLNANASRSARTRNSRNDSSANDNASQATNPSDASTAPPPAITPPPVVAQHPAPPPVENKNAVAPASNKNEAKKEEKKRGFFGKIKDALTGGKKEENKNRKP